MSPRSVREPLFAVLLSCGALMSASPTPAAADDFYKGRQIHLIVGTGPAGGYSVYARLIAQYMPRHITGNPFIVVENLGGANGIKAANYIYNIAPRDGTYIASANNSFPTAPLLSPEGTQFDVNRLSWLGSITEEPFVGYVWHTAPIKTFEDVKSTEVVLGGNALSGSNVDYAIISNALFGTKIRLITGYPDMSDINLAMERGEVQGNFAVSWSILKNTIPEWLKSRQVRVFVQFGFERHPDLPDVPLFIDQAKTPEDKELLNLVLARQQFSKPYFAPPQIPTERLELLRRAFDATTKDADFIAAANAASLGVDRPMTGENLAALVGRLSQTPDSVTHRLENLLVAYETTRK